MVDLQSIKNDVFYYGADILSSEGMQSSRNFYQHGSISVYEHSVSVACVSLALSRALLIDSNERSLVRGALLHDYFLYDWHVPDKSHKFHGLTHARTALRNAQRDFNLNKIEKDMIIRHMFPLNITPPKYRESVILCIADKICAAFEASKCVVYKSLEFVG